MRRWAAASLLPLVTVICGCASATQNSLGSRNSVSVVATEAAWADLAGQVGGRHATVALVTSTDGASSSRWKTAAYVIVNGAGADPWAAASAAGTLAKVLTVAKLAGKSSAAPDFWYDQQVVGKVVNRIASDLSALDPADKDYFASQAKQLTTSGLGHYGALRSQVTKRYSGELVAAADTVASQFLSGLGFQNRTTTIAPGTKALVVTAGEITSDSRALIQAASSKHIPVVTITTAPVPASRSYESWQAAEVAPAVSPFQSKPMMRRLW